MRALVYENSLPRLAATRLLSAFSPRAFVGPLAPVALREIPDPELPAPDWVTLRKRIEDIASVERVELLSLSLHEATVRLTFYGDESQLALAFAQRDMELKQGSIDWSLRMVASGPKATTGSAVSP